MKHPSREVGLQLYSNPQYKQKLLEAHGQTFVDQCLELAIQVVPSRRFKNKSIQGTSTFKSKGKSRMCTKGVRLK